ncbi:MAG: glycosyltransferase [Actinobacteria bacterium]|nr:glycosyltransferase [Actinomycetota bacterium]
MVRHVGLITVHTSPLAQPGTGDGGGLNVYVLEVARDLAQRGIEVDVFTRAVTPSAPPRVEVETGVRVHHVVAGPTRPLLKEELHAFVPEFARAVLRRPESAELDIIHSHYWLSGWVGRHVGTHLGIPLVHTFHTLGVVKNAALADFDVPEPPARLDYERRLAAEADHLVALTCGEARLLHRTFGTSGARISVVPAGVDLDLFQPQAEERGDDPEPRLLFVGRLQPIKAPDVAVRTLAELHRTHPRTRLRIIGGVSGTGAGRSGPDQLLALAKRLGVSEHVEVHPARPQAQLAAVYREADVVVVPSRSESFSLVALEAQASGTPVVAAHVGGLADVVRGGSLVSGHDPVAHADAVRRFLDDAELTRATGLRGRAHAQRFSWQGVVDGLLEVYARARQPALRAAG